MIGYNYNDEMPPILLDVNCETPLTISMYNFLFLKGDKVIFSIKKSNRKEAESIYTYEITKEALNEESNISLIIPAEVTNQLSEKSFYNFTLRNKEGKVYSLTGNGRIVLRYGANN